MVVQQTGIQRANQRHAAYTEQQAGVDEAVGDAGAGLVRAGNPLLQPVKKAGHPPVNVHPFADGGADNHAEDHNQRVFSLHGPADTQIDGAQSQPLHKGVVQPLGDVLLEDHAYGAACQNGEGVDNGSE